VSSPVLSCASGLSILDVPSGLTFLRGMVITCRYLI
jgi:hypothetical protein